MSDWNGEIFITKEECKRILEEVYRVLQKGAFVIISHFGYHIERVENIQIIGPTEREIITPEMIIKMAEEVGFRNIVNIPLDENRINLAMRLRREAWPEAIRDMITSEIRGSTALFMEK
jgi:hypothetical protein